DLAVHRAPDEHDAGRHAHVEMDLRIIVLRVHAPFVAGRAAVRLLAGDVRIDGADRDAVGALNHLDADFRRVAAHRALGCRHLNVPGPRRRGADVAVHALDLDGLPGGQMAPPLTVLRGCR